MSITGMTLALLRNYNPFNAPTHFKIVDLLRKFDKTFGATGRNYGKVTGDRTLTDIEKRRADRWNFLFIAGMWFRICSTTTSAAPNSASSPDPRRREIASALITRCVGWRNIVRRCT